MKNAKIRLAVVLMVFGGIFLLSDSIMNAGEEIEGIGWLIDWVFLVSGGLIFFWSEWKA